MASEPEAPYRDDDVLLDASKYLLYRRGVHHICNEDGHLERTRTSLVGYPDESLREIGKAILRVTRTAIVVLHRHSEVILTPMKARILTLKKSLMFDLLSLRQNSSYLLKSTI